jgi:purine-binding chemotaxis protein CheW
LGGLYSEGYALNVKLETRSETITGELRESAEDGTERILRQRAQRLAEIPLQEEMGESIDVLVFRIGEEHYAFRAALLRMVHRAVSLTPIPCTPAFVAGMLNVRGEVVTVLNLGVALGLPGIPPPDQAASILLAECAGIRVGLLVDEILGIQPLTPATMAPPLSGNNFALGIAEARIVFLDLERLLLSGRFDVLEDVG